MLAGMPGECNARAHLDLHFNDVGAEGAGRLLVLRWTFDGSRLAQTRSCLWR